MSGQNKTKAQLLKEIEALHDRVRELESRESSLKWAKEILQEGEEQLRASRERYHAIVENIGIGVAVIDPDMRILELNETMRSWFPKIDTTQKPICYRAYNDPPRDAACSYCPTIKTLQDGKVHEAITNTPAGDSIRHYRIVSSALKNADAHVVAAIEMVEDITESKQAEEQRLSLEQQVQHSQKLESMGVLAGGIAHDFNNLLTAIPGNAEVALLDISPDSPVRESVDAVKRGALRAAELANQMLAYSGKGHFVLEKIDVPSFILEMGQLLKSSISKKANLTYDLPESLPPIEADATKIRQVIMNLITNASEALGDESGAITIRANVIEADRELLSQSYLDEDLPPGTYVCLEVSDTGYGMDEEAKLRLFEPFFTTKFTGRGLGLAAVLGIVRGHKGAIYVSSEIGQGTSIKISFPAIEGPAMARTVADLPDTECWKGKGVILLVEDEDDVRKIIARTLERLGFKVIAASDGQAGVEAFSQHADEVALVLLDLSMPVMNGGEVFQELLKIRPNVQVLLCSGYTEKEATKRFEGMALAGFLQKPFQLADLTRKLQEILRFSED
jgi:signal transduction histidine kinase